MKRINIKRIPLEQISLEGGVQFADGLTAYDLPSLWFRKSSAH